MRDVVDWGMGVMDGGLVIWIGGLLTGCGGYGWSGGNGCSEEYG